MILDRHSKRKSAYRCKWTAFPWIFWPLSEQNNMLRALAHLPSRQSSTNFRKQLTMLAFFLLVASILFSFRCYWLSWAGCFVSRAFVSFSMSLGHKKENKKQQIKWKQRDGQRTILATMDSARLMPNFRATKPMWSLLGDRADAPSTAIGYLCVC